MRPSLFSLATVLTLCPTLAGAQGFTYEYEALPVPPVSRATGINSAGDVVGTTFAFGPPQAYIIEDGVPTLFLFPGSLASLADDINNDGVILGGYSLSGTPTDANITWNVGITKIRRTMIQMPATEKMTPG